MIEQDMFVFNTFAELNDYYFRLFMALSDVGPALSKKFLKTVEKRILERYEMDYKLMKMDIKFSFRTFKKDKKQLQKRIRKAQRNYYNALKKGKDTTGIDFVPRYSPKDGEDNKAEEINLDRENSSEEQQEKGEENTLEREEAHKDGPEQEFHS